MQKLKKPVGFLLAAVVLLGVFFHTSAYGTSRFFAADTQEAEADALSADLTAEGMPAEEEPQTADPSEMTDKAETTGGSDTDETAGQSSSAETTPPVLPPTVPGDADNDGTVTAADARLVLRAAVGLETLVWPEICDLNADGKVTAYDARGVLRFAVGLELEETEAEKAARAEQVRRYLEKKAEEESRKAAEEESRKAAEEESRKAAEEESRKAAEEAKRKAEEEAKRKAEEEAKRKAEEEARRKAEEERKNREKKRADWLASFPAAVSYDDLQSNMYWLVNDIGQRSWWNSTQNAAADLIYTRLGAYGYSDSNRRKIDFTRGGITGRNVMAVIPTAKSNPKILLIVAHYDTARGIGGAVDNSSGTAALLQLAKRFRATWEDYGIEVRFLFTAGEEQGYYGAYAYVNALSAAEKNRHIFVFNLDMAGKPNNSYEPGRSYFLAVSTEPIATDGYYPGAAKANIGSTAVDQAKAALGNLGENGYYSPVRAGVHDIVPFRKAGMPALTLSWRCYQVKRSEGADYGLASPYFIHTAEDNMSYFDMNSLYNTTRLAAGAIARLILPYTNY